MPSECENKGNKANLKSPMQMQQYPLLTLTDGHPSMISQFLKQVLLSGNIQIADDGDGNESIQIKIRQHEARDASSAQVRRGQSAGATKEEDVAICKSRLDKISPLLILQTSAESEIEGGGASNINIEVFSVCSFGLEDDKVNEFCRSRMNRLSNTGS
jgi:hypothetical protein